MQEPDSSSAFVHFLRKKKKNEVDVMRWMDIAGSGGGVCGDKNGGNGGIYAFTEAGEAEGGDRDEGRRRVGGHRDFCCWVG